MKEVWLTIVLLIFQPSGEAYLIPAIITHNDCGLAARRIKQQFKAADYVVLECESHTFNLDRYRRE